jgi:hypothetical protein
MDKLENESWEEYAFRHELFEIIYADKEKQIIDYINLPNPDKYSYPVYTICSTFDGFIWNKIKEIKNKYSNMRSHDCTRRGFSNFGLSLLSNEDNELQQNLYALRDFWQPKERDIFASRHLNQYNRSVELTKVISETHKEELKELLSIINRRPPLITNEQIEYPQYIEEINEGKREVIELYQKYKNKEILLQIIELEKKVSNLQKKLIK